MSKRRKDKKAAQGCCDVLGEVLQAGLFRALCDRNRVALLGQLAECGRPCSVSEIATCCPVDLSVVSRHLACLRDAGIVKAEKRGKEVYYSVCFGELTGTLRAMADAIEACCGGSPQAEPKTRR